MYVCVVEVMNTKSMDCLQEQVLVAVGHWIE